LAGLNDCVIGRIGAAHIAMHLEKAEPASYIAGVKTMANKINSVPTLKPDTEKPTIIDGSDNPEKAKHEKMERGADRAAHKAAETQQKYDADHTTISN
jgi:hypothetical protein